MRKTNHISAVASKKPRRTVTVIPATAANTAAGGEAPGQTPKRRVAAYARVSTGREDQLTSYEAQINYYTSYIQSRADWAFAGMYADEGISGTSMQKRSGFRRMIRDAMAGKIDLILTKSVSRFARNTVDSLSTIRKLKARGVECYFEKENIRTMDSKGELLITIMSSLAQEESRSISENTRWGMRKAFENGRAFVPFKHFLGYEKSPGGKWVINPQQAETVRLIYTLFLQGATFYGIAAELTRRETPTPCGGKKWNAVTVKNILQNEKYRGDALLQKRYSRDFLNKKMLLNHGEVPQYYIKGCHEAIIEPPVFERVQAEIARRAALRQAQPGTGGKR